MTSQCWAARTSTAQLEVQGVYIVYTCNTHRCHSTSFNGWYFIIRNSSWHYYDTIVPIPCKCHSAPRYLTSHLWRTYRWDSNTVSSHVQWYTVISIHQSPPSSFRTWQPHLCLHMFTNWWVAMVQETSLSLVLWTTATHQLVNKLWQVEGQTPPFRWLLGIWYSLVSSKGNTRARLTSVCESLEPSWVVGPIMITIYIYSYVRFLIVWTNLDCQMQPGTGWNHMGVPFELSVFSSTGRNQWHPQSRSLSPSDLLMQE